MEAETWANILKAFYQEHPPLLSDQFDIRAGHDLSFLTEDDGAR
jgi:hypothetical protein